MFIICWPSQPRIIFNIKFKPIYSSSYGEFSHFTSNFLQINVTAEAAEMIISSVSEIISDFVPADQDEDNLNIVANVYEQVGGLINEGRLDASENVSSAHIIFLPTPY